MRVIEDTSYSVKQGDNETEKETRGACPVLLLIKPQAGNTLYGGGMVVWWEMTRDMGALQS